MQKKVGFILLAIGIVFAIIGIVAKNYNYAPEVYFLLSLFLILGSGILLFTKKYLLLNFVIVMAVGTKFIYSFFIGLSIKSDIVFSAIIISMYLMFRIVKLKYENFMNLKHQSNV